MKGIFSLFMRALVVIALLAVALAALAPPALAVTGALIPDPITLDDLLLQLAKLTGVPALVAVLINALKQFGVVQDGWAPLWSTGFNLLILILLFVAHIVGFTNLDQLDQVAATLAQIGTFVLALLYQLLISRATHAAVKGVPVIGYSYTMKAAAGAY